MPEVAGVEPQFQDPPGGRIGALLLAQGTASGIEHLKGSLGADGVIGHDPLRGVWIRLAQQGVALALAQRF